MYLQLREQEDIKFLDVTELSYSSDNGIEQINIKQMDKTLLTVENALEKELHQPIPSLRILFNTMSMRVSEDAIVDFSEAVAYLTKKGAKIVHLDKTLFHIPQETTNSWILRERSLKKVHLYAIQKDIKLQLNEQNTVELLIELGDKKVLTYEVAQDIYNKTEEDLAIIEKHMNLFLRSSLVKKGFHDVLKVIQTVFWLVE